MKASGVRSLEEDWLRSLDAVAAGRGWPTSRDAAKLGAAVAALSASYNDASRARASAKDAGAARLGFSFARDVPKSAGAVRELVGTGRLALRGETLRVLDVGAGLGATTWGVVRALEAAGGRGIVEATWVDADAGALALAGEILRERQKSAPSAIELRVRTVVRGAGPFDDLGAFDLVLAGQVLSELDVGADPGARVERHAALLATWLENRVDAHGSLVVVEPALRDRTRHLHRVRDALAGRATIFAPCLHAAPCPMLASEGDWCHEDLDVDLPAGLVPVARAAGLRREGLTFSYLVLRKDGATLAGSLDAPARAGRLRVVSGRMPSKGKLEAFVCGEVATETGSLQSARVKAMRLDREANPDNVGWETASRGDVLVVDPAVPGAKPRIGAHFVVRISSPSIESR
jgi:SAM-dependent methyltransferase